MQPGTAMCFLNFYTLVFWTPLMNNRGFSKSTANWFSKSKSTANWHVKQPICCLLLLPLRWPICCVWLLAALSWISWFLCHYYSCCYHSAVLATLTMLSMTSFVRLASPWYLSCWHRSRQRRRPCRCHRHDRRALDVGSDHAHLWGLVVWHMADCWPC